MIRRLSKVATVLGIAFIGTILGYVVVTLLGIEVHITGIVIGSLIGGIIGEHLL